MALIGKIRKNSWLLVILIGMALAAFIIMDMVAGQTSAFGSDQTSMGAVAGKKLDWKEFSRAEQIQGNILYGGSGANIYGRRSLLWDYYVEEAIVSKEADELGLAIGQAELEDALFGNNLSTIITQRFRNPQTGQVDRQSLNQAKQAIEANTTDPQYREFWKIQVDEVKKERLQNKLNNLVSKAIYTPTWMVEKTHQENSNKLDFRYVKIPFDEIENSSVEVSDADFNAFLSNNKAKYVQNEETRKISYISFNVSPTSADTLAIKQSIAEKISDFRTTDNDTIFVENNYGSIDGAYVNREALADAVADDLFTAELGSVLGPYQDGNTFKAVKLLDRKVIPDSVRARHILRRATTQAEFIAAVTTIDSIKTALESGSATWDAMVQQSQDFASVPQGGDQGFAGQGKMVKPFNDMIFFEGKKGEYNTVISQFGVHLVEVMDYKFLNNEEGVKVAYISNTIVPSQETQDLIQDKALEFLATNKTLADAEAAIANDSDLELVTTPAIKRNDYIAGQLGSEETSRKIIKWAYGASTGEIAPAVYDYQDPIDLYVNKYVVAGLQSKQAAGDVSLANIRSEIEADVRKNKKGEMIKAKVNGTDFNSIVSSFTNAAIDTARNISFTSNFLPGLGSEPKVISNAFKLALNGVSQPIIGTSGVYVIQPITNANPVGELNIPQLRQQTESVVKGQVGTRLMQALVKNADVEDNRSRFY